MDSVFELHQRLQHYKEANPDRTHEDDCYDQGRHTYCHIMAYRDAWHKFEVRGWQTTKDYTMIEIACVNWTMAAGTCILVIQADNIHKFKILEDEPTLQVLYG